MNLDPPPKWFFFSREAREARANLHLTLFLGEGKIQDISLLIVLHYIFTFIEFYRHVPKNCQFFLGIYLNFHSSTKPWGDQQPTAPAEFVGPETPLWSLHLWCGGRTWNDHIVELHFVRCVFVLLNLIHNMYIYIYVYFQWISGNFLRLKKIIQRVYHLKGTKNHLGVHCRKIIPARCLETWVLRTCLAPALRQELRLWPGMFPNRNRSSELDTAKPSSNLTLPCNSPRRFIEF